MYYLNTRFPTIIFDDYIMDPSIMNNLIEESDEKRIAEYMIINTILRNVIHILIL